MSILVSLGNLAWGHDAVVQAFLAKLRVYPVGEADRKWFAIWIRRYAEFLERSPDEALLIDRPLALRFCRELLSHGTPAWQRLQALRCLIAYRGLVLGQSDDLLTDMRTKLADLAADESQGSVGVGGQALIEDGPATPNEPGFLIDFRRTLRRRRMKYDTEKAYASWLIRFTRWAGIEDPSSLGEMAVREFLTEVALGNSPGANQEVSRREAPAGNGCAASTQNQAKSALLYFFKQHVGRELGFIDVISASTPPRLPVVMTE